MNFNELYNIALDVLSEKKSNGFGFSVNDNSTITVLSTPQGDIIKASNGSVIKNGQLQNTCSEYEAVTSMMKSNKNRIENLITLDIESGNFVIPCNNCLDLIIQINPENLDSNVMVGVNETVKLHTLISNNDDIKSNTNVTVIEDKKGLDSFENWLDGWEDDSTESNDNFGVDNTDDVKSISSEKSVKSISFDDNPIPNKPDNSTKKIASSYYQSKYLNSAPNPVSSSVTSMNSTTFKKKNNEISDRMRQNGLSEKDKKDFNKQRLYNAFTVENVLNVNGTQSNNVAFEVAEKQTLSKKELIKLAKEKKKMAKKDAKILEASNKKML